MPSTERAGSAAAGKAGSAALCTAALLAVFAYPFAFDALIARAGVRGAALLALALAWLSLAALRRRWTPPGASARPALGVPIALVLALLSGDVRALLLVPACVQLGLALVFARSLSGGRSLIFDFVRWRVPEAPDFVAPYCRKLTALWAGFFGVAAAVIAGLALAGSHESWRRASGSGLYALMLVFSGLEFFFRKTWFRYYFHGGPFDRLWSRLFPAEATVKGRQSLAYIRRYREELAAGGRREISGDRGCR